MPKHFKHFFFHPWWLCHSPITSCFSPLLLRISTCPVHHHITNKPALSAVTPAVIQSTSSQCPLDTSFSPPHPSLAFYWIQAPLLGFFSHCHYASCLSMLQSPTLRFSSLIFLTCQGLHWGFRLFFFFPLWHITFTFCVCVCLHPFDHKFTKCDFLESKGLVYLIHCYIWGCLLAYTKHLFDIYKIKIGEYIQITWHGCAVNSVQ